MAKETRHPNKRHSENARRLAWLEAQAPLGWAVILVLVALLGTVYVNQASRTAAVGRSVQLQQQRIEELKRQNSSLERDIAQAQELSRLQEKADQLKFIAPTADQIQYIIVPNYPVPDEISATQPVASPLGEPAQTFQAAVWQVVSGHLTDLVRGESGE